MLNSRIFFLLFIILFSLICQQKNFASNSKYSDRSSPLIIHDQKEISKKFTRGESFRQGEFDYTLYPDLKAEFNEKKNRKKLIKEHNLNKLYMTESLIIYNHSSSMSDKIKYKNQVVFNEVTETFGILSGMIIVKMKNNAEFNDPYFVIYRKYLELGYYILELPDKIKIQDSIKKIKMNKDVEEFMVEILENFYETL